MTGRGLSLAKRKDGADTGDQERRFRKSPGIDDYHHHWDTRGRTNGDSSRPRTADHNLLFGVLALQLDFITQKQLIDGMQAWVTEKSVALSNHLVRLGHLSAAKAVLLEPLIAEHVRQHGNDPVKSLQAVSSAGWVAGLLKPVVGKDLEIAASLGHLRPSPPVASGQPIDAPADENATEVETIVESARAAGRFRILRPHDKGGLGKVSVALDTELGREVAFKEIQPDHAANPNNRSRFVLEAEITGGLEHPGIVPVYGLGSYPDGQPFYAMRFISGESFAKAIRRFHDKTSQVTLGTSGRNSNVTSDRNLGLRELLGRFVDVCQAIAYAHSRGVLHRDLKPDNIV